MTRFLPVCRIVTVQVARAGAVAPKAMRRQARARARAAPRPGHGQPPQGGPRGEEARLRRPVGPFTTAAQLRLASQTVPRYHHLSRAGALSRACTGAACAATRGV